MKGVKENVSASYETGSFKHFFKKQFSEINFYPVYLKGGFCIIVSIAVEYVVSI